jgi:hypothetical protein
VVGSHQLSSSAGVKSQKMILTKNEDINFINNGNVDLKVTSSSSSKNITMMGEQDSTSTKVDAESERGEKSSKRAPKRRTKSKGADDVAAIVEEEGEVSKKKKKRHHKKHLLMNVAQTKYFVVRYVGKKVYKMKLTRSDDEDWDICWQDGAVSCD